MIDLWNTVPYAFGIIAALATIGICALVGRIGSDERCPYCDAPRGSRHYNGCKWGGL